MSTIRVVNLQHPDSVEPNVVLNTDGTATFVSGITNIGSTNLTVSGTATFASGTVASPSITFIDDTNTGFYSPTADTVAVSTGGSERVRVTSTGLGIGTSPTNPLTIQQSAVSNAPARSAALYVENNANCEVQMVGNAANDCQLRFGTSSNSFKGAVEYQLDVDALLAYTNGSERMRIASDGKIGIGTNNPSRLVHIKGSGTEQQNLFLESTTTNSRIEFINTQTTSTGNRVAIGARNDSFSVNIGSSLSTRLVVDPNGNVGIGIAAPLGKLQVRAADECNFVVREEATQLVLSAETNNGRDNNRVMKLESSQFLFIISSTERMRIGSTGNVAIGTNSPNSKLHVSSGDASFTPHADADELFLENTDHCGMTIGCGTDKTGNIFFGEQGVGIRRGAIVYDTNSDYLAFSTAGFVNERMRIGSSGNIFTGGTNSASAIEAGTQAGKVFKSNHAASSGATFTGTAFHFSFANPNGFCGSISTNGSATAFNTSSDYRLKENVVDLDGAIDRVKQLAPKRFNFIADADTVVDGFLAHEAQVVVPEAVTGIKDEVDEEDNPVMQGIDQAKFVPLLTAALQEAVAKIETLEQRLTDAGL